MKRAGIRNKRQDAAIIQKSCDSEIKAVLPFAAVVFSLITALLYCYGYIYYQTYLKTWGLPEDLFPLSREGSIIAGFFQVISYGVRSFGKLIIPLSTLLFVMIVLLLSCYRRFSNLLTGALSRLRGNLVPLLQRVVIITPIREKLVDVMGAISMLILVFASLFLLLIFSCQSIAKKAKEHANKERERLEKVLSGAVGGEALPSTPRATLFVNNGLKGFDVYSGHLINTSSTHCALFDKNKGVSIFPLTNIARIIVREK